MSRPFLIVASSRKGTHLVITALAGHSGLTVHDQVFSDPDYMKDVSGPSLAHSLLIAPNSFSAVLPVSWDNARTDHVGFWEYLRDRDVGVIHLHRKNMLRWYVSLHLAIATNSWIAHDPPKTTSTRLVIEPTAFALAVSHDWRDERHARRFFDKQRQLHVWYEDIATNFHWQMARIQDFLGVEIRKLQPTCFKQQTRPLPNVIVNYDELRAKWEGTPFESFLTGDPCQGVSPREVSP